MPSSAAVADDTWILRKSQAYIWMAQEIADADRLELADHLADFAAETLIRSAAGANEIGARCDQTGDEFGELPGGGAKYRPIILGYFRQSGVGFHSQGKIRRLAHSFANRQEGFYSPFFCLE